MLAHGEFEIDEVDLKIIEALMKNARADFKDIASVVGVSDRTVARRIERLEECGVIRGYYVDLDHSLLLESGIDLSDYDEYVRLSRVEWEELWNALGKIMGAGLGVLLFHAGRAVGLEVGSKLRGRYEDLEAALKILPSLLRDRGCRECKLIEFDQSSCVGKFEFVKQTITPRKQGVVFFEWLRGILQGALEAITGKRVEVVEESSSSISVTYRFSYSGVVKEDGSEGKDWHR
jgi:DNA-binding Lrp family transcriptional regulator